MVKALPRAFDENTYYSQSNNAIEAILRKTGVADWLESCGPTSAVMIVAALGGDVSVTAPGGWQPQPEDVLTLWFNDPRNTAQLSIQRPEVNLRQIMGNRVPQYYERAMPEVLGVKARFYFGCSALDISMAIGNGRGVMACLRKPGHYIAIVGDDIETSEFIYNDAWSKNPWPAAMAGMSGFNRRIPYADLIENLQPYRVEIGI